MGGGAKSVQELVSGGKGSRKQRVECNEGEINRELWKMTKETKCRRLQNKKQEIKYRFWLQLN